MGKTTPKKMIQLGREEFLLRSALFIFILSFLTTVSGAPARFVPGQILVKPRPGVAEVELDDVVLRQGGRQHRVLHRSNIRVVRVTEKNSEAVLAALKRDPSIEFAERDYVAEAAFVPNDPLVRDGSEWHLARIQAPLAWNGTTGDGAVVVAVLDSGINAAHPDLAGKILPGYDFVWNDSDPADDFGHGTAVAGVIAGAGNNGVGVAGVAYGCKILPVKVMDASGFAAYSTVAQGIRYAVDNGARVINISIAGSSPSSTLQDAINYAWSNNVVVVAAAGNSANTTPQYPAACEHVVAVSATEPDDTLASFSSTGDHLALAAPGDNIWTTQRDLADPYGAWRGSSLACPIVAAAAALVASANPSLSATQIVSTLEQTADDLGAVGFDSSFGFGRVNVGRAVSAALGIPLDIATTPPLIPPVVNIASPLDKAQVAFGAMLGVTINAAAGSTNTSVTNVLFSANGITIASFTAPPYFVNWRPTATGSFSLTALATDDAGQQTSSAAIAVRVYSNAPSGPLLAALSLTTNGLGKVRTFFKGTNLVVGQTYTVKALPGTGQVFAGWDGIASMNSSLTFVMQPGLALVAKFVPTPFIPTKGSYAGLVWNTNGVTPESSGNFTLTVTSLGAFGGKIMVGGARVPVTGAFDLNGDATVSVPRGTSSPLTITLHVDLTNGTDEVTGTIGDAHWTSALAGDRNVFSPFANPAPQAGQRAFVLEQENAATNAAATGLSKINIVGRATMSGKLGDGRRFTMANGLAKNGDYPFYLSFNRNSEVVIGWMNFPAGTPAANGTVYWVKNGTNGFAATLQAAAVLPPTIASR